MSLSLIFDDIINIYNLHLKDHYTKITKKAHLGNFKASFSLHVFCDIKLNTFKGFMVWSDKMKLGGRLQFGSGRNPFNCGSMFTLQDCIMIIIIIFILSLLLLDIFDADPYNDLDVSDLNMVLKWPISLSGV